VSPHLAFDTAVSVVTNTDWQSSPGETTVSYFSQMVGLTLHHFASAATGIAVAAALVRGIARRSGSTLGHFWVDLVRVTYFLLLPMSLVFALVLVGEGVPQNFEPYTTATPVESSSVPVAASETGRAVEAADGERAPREQTIVQGPIASQVAIKMLGTNGGGYTNANAAHGFENPTPLSNFLQMLSMFAIGSALTYYFGRSVGNVAHGWTIWVAMMVLFLIGAGVCWWAEASGNPMHHALGVDPSDGNMEGKEVRFGIFGSALFATITTAASCGAVNAMHDSFTAMGGLVLLFDMQLGEVVIGGVGAGLYSMLVFVVLAVFVAGLLVGRTPQYLGKRIEAYEVKMAMLSLLVPAVCTLGFSAWAGASVWGKAGPNDGGPHGLSEILYAFTSAAANNGSAFAGLSANEPWYDTTLGLAMLAGRFLVVVPVLAMAGSLVRKNAAPTGIGTLPVSGATFCVLLVGTLVLVGALGYLPVLFLGPIVEHVVGAAGQLF
ncbi:MAG: potassium-transporting ATPase subunit KdpA, partial [Verrucomicrobiales bacterium]|nr:potassium-transporting ATPase subunit KdpA [Verrucomicrobiales bacterium]